MHSAVAPVGPGAVVMLGVTFVTWLIGVTVGLVFAAVILRSACHFARVRVPHFVKAMGVALVEVFVSLPVWAADAVIAGQVRAARAVPATSFWAVNGPAMAAIGLAVAAVLFTLLLGVGIGRALLIALIRLAIYGLIAAMVVGMLVGMGVDLAIIAQEL